MKTRILALLLTVIMTVSILPAAAESEPGSPLPEAEGIEASFEEIPDGAAEDNEIPLYTERADDDTAVPTDSVTADETRDGTADETVPALLSTAAENGTADATSDDGAPEEAVQEPAAPETDIPVTVLSDETTEEADLPEEMPEDLPAENSSEAPAEDSAGETPEETGTEAVEEAGEENGKENGDGTSDLYQLSEPANLSTAAAGPEITQQPLDATAVLNSNVFFKTAASGEELTYQWQYRDNAESAWHTTSLTGCKTDTLTVTATLARNGKQYRCVITDKSGASAVTQEATLTVRQVTLKIDRQPVNQSGALNDVVTFSVEATGDGLTYQWKYREGSGDWANATAAGAKTALFSPTVSKLTLGRQYCCEITDAYGSKMTTNTVKITEAVLIVTQPVNVSAGYGKTVTFSVEAKGTGLTYRWQYSAADETDWHSTSLSGYNTPVLTVEATAARNGNKYRCVVTNQYGNSVASNAAVLKMTQLALKIITQPSNASGKINDTVSFTTEASGDGLTYQWMYREGTDGEWRNAGADGANTAVLKPVISAARLKYQYCCKVKDAYGNTLTTKAVKIVENIVITSQPVSVSNALNTNAKFTVKASGTGLTYKWQYRTSQTDSWHSTSLTGYNTATLTVPITRERDGNQYRCVITNISNVSVTSDVVSLALKRAPLKITKQPVNQAAENGAAVTFSVAATGDGVSYQWQYRIGTTGEWNSATATGNKTASLSLSINATTLERNYRCLITDLYGNTQTSSVVKLTEIVKITAQPVSAAAGLNKNAFFTVKAKGTNLTYQWQYRKDESSDWKNTSLTGNKTATLTVPSTQDRDGNQYRCVVKNGYGSSVATNAVTLTLSRAALTITAQPANIGSAAGNSVRFTVNAAGDVLTYQWQYRTSSTGSWNNCVNNGAKTNTFTVLVESAKISYQYRCVISDLYGNKVNSTAVKVNEVLKITTQPSNASAKLDANARFTVAVSGTGLTYQWKYRTNEKDSWHNCSRTGSQTATVTIPVSVTNDGYQYCCVIKNADGITVTSKAATLTVSRTALKITTQPVDSKGAVGGTAKFTVTATGDKLTYLWKYRTSSTGAWKDCSASGYNTSTFTPEFTAARLAYQYCCEIKDIYGNKVTSNVVCLKEVLKITAHPAGVSGALNASVSFSVAATGTSLSYQWQYRTSETAAWQNSGLSGYTSSKLTVTVTAARDGWQFRCMVKSGSVSMATKAATLTVKHTPLKITGQPVSGNATLGNSVKLTVTAQGDELNYSWFYRTSSAGEWKTSSDSGRSTKTLSVTVSADRQNYEYRCVITDAWGNSVTSNAVRVTQTLKITSQPVSATAASGKNVTFTVTASGYQLTYQWKYLDVDGKWKNTSLTGSSTKTLTVEAQLKRDGKQYKCVITDGNGASITSNAVTFTLKKTPLAITTQPVNAKGYLDTAAKFTVVATGDDLSYQWQYRTSSSGSWMNSDAAGNKTATFKPVFNYQKPNYQYRCVITDGYGNSITTNTVMIHLADDAFKITKQPSSVTVAAGAIVTFTVQATGAKSYQWQVLRKDMGDNWIDTQIDGYNTNSIRMEANKNRAALRWRCVVTMLDGKEVTSNAVHLTISGKKTGTKVVYDVPLYYQGQYQLCWSFSQQMVEDYNLGLDHTLDEAKYLSKERSIEIFGDEYWDQGYRPTDEIGKEAERSEITASKLYDMLVEAGPCYLSYGQYSYGKRVGGHELVLTGVDVTNNVVYVNNPWEISGTQSLSNFLNYFIGGPKNEGWTLETVIEPDWGRTYGTLN